MVQSDHKLVSFKGGDNEPRTLFLLDTNAILEIGQDDRMCRQWGPLALRSPENQEPPMDCPKITTDGPQSQKETTVPEMPGT